MLAYHNNVTTINHVPITIHNKMRKKYGKVKIEIMDFYSETTLCHPVPNIICKLNMRMQIRDLVAFRNEDNGIIMSIDPHLSNT